MPKRKPGYTIRSKEVATLIKGWMLSGASVAKIADRLKFMGIKNHCERNIKKYYKEEVKITYEMALDLAAGTALQMAINGDRTMLCFVLKCKGGWREGSDYSINIDKMPTINIICEADESAERNKLE